MRRLKLFRGGRPQLAVESVEELTHDETCNRCVLSEGTDRPCMRPVMRRGAADNETLLLVFEAPTMQESRVRQPNGRQTSEIVRIVSKYWSGPIAITFAVLCPSLGKPRKSTLDGCRPYLKRTIAGAAPDRIMLFGSAAMQMVLGHGYTTADLVRGYTRMSDGTLVFLQKPPGLITSNRLVADAFEDDVRWALETAKADIGEVSLGSFISIVKTREDVDGVLADLDFSDRYATIDLETFGRPKTAEFRILNFGVAGSHGYGFVLDAESLIGESDIGKHLLLGLMKRVSAGTLSVGGANVKYDIVSLACHYDLPPMSIGFDTQLFRRLLYPNVLGALKYAQVSVGVSGGKDDSADKLPARKVIRDIHNRPPEVEPETIYGLPYRLVKEAARKVVEEGKAVDMYSYAGIPSDKRSIYNGKDVITTAALRGKYAEEMRVDGSAALVWERITQPLIDAVSAMETNGFRVDKSKIGELHALTQSQVQGALEVLVPLADINWNSSQQVLATMRKLTGNPRLKSADAAALKQIDHPAAKALQAYRRACKFKSNYADGVLYGIRDDGRVRCSYRIDGTESGRPSASDPNLLNIPKPKTDLGRLCRDMFVAEEGNVLIELDMSQIELRVAAGLSGDEAMIGLFRDGIDFHLGTARLVAPIFGYDPAKVGAEHKLRDMAKGFNFSVLYGKSSASLAEDLGVALEEALRVEEAILGSFPGLKKWILEKRKFAAKQGYTYTWWDGIEPFRKRPLPDIAGSNTQKAGTADRGSYNTPVQGTAADFTHASLGRVHKDILAGKLHPSTKLCLTVYDSMMLEVEEAHALDTAKHIKGVMESWNTPNDVPLKADCKIGYRWGSLETVEI